MLAWLCDSDDFPHKGFSTFLLNLSVIFLINPDEGNLLYLAACMSVEFLHDTLNVTGM